MLYLMEMTYKSNFLNLIIGLFILNGVFAQDTASIIDNPNKITDSIIIAHSDFTSDRFDALYIVSPDDELLKLNSKLKINFRYSNSRLGTISSIDVSNPLATICFYEDFQSIVLLDRTLNPLTEIDLGDWGFSNVTAACSSGNNQIWIYDASDMQLIQIAKDRSTPTRTFPINLHTDDPFIITKMMVKQENLYCLTAKGNLYKLSLIGESLQKILGSEQYVDFQFSGNRLLVQDKQRHIYHYKSLLDLKQLPFSLPQNGTWCLQNGAFLVGDGKRIWLMAF